LGELHQLGELRGRKLEAREERTGLELFVASAVSIAHNMEKALRRLLSAQEMETGHCALEGRVVYR
jgi:hypothetical protein